MRVRVSECACVCVCVCVHACTDLCVCAPVCTCAHACACVCVSVCVDMWLCAQVCMRVSTSVPDGWEQGNAIVALCRAQAACSSPNVAPLMRCPALISYTNLCAHTRAHPNACPHSQAASQAFFGGGGRGCGHCQLYAKLGKKGQSLRACRPRVPVMPHRPRVPVMPHRPRVPVMPHRPRVPVMPHRP